MMYIFLIVKNYNVSEIVFQNFFVMWIKWIMKIHCFGFKKTRSWTLLFSYADFITVSCPHQKILSPLLLASSCDSNGLSHSHFEIPFFKPLSPFYSHPTFLLSSKSSIFTTLCQLMFSICQPVHLKMI